MYQFFMAVVYKQCLVALVSILMPFSFSHCKIRALRRPRGFLRATQPC